MDPRPEARITLRVGCRTRMALLALALSLPLPTWIAGQQTGAADLPGQELAYRSARSQHQATLDAWSAVENRFNAAVEEHARARRAGDQEGQDVSLTRALDLARELDRLERRVTEGRGQLEDARSALVEAVDRRIELLEEQLMLARPAEAQRLGAVLRDLENQQAALAREAEGAEVRVELVRYRSIQYDPRDDAGTLAAKAELLRSKAEQADTVIAEIDRDIGRIERQLRRSRNVESLVSGVERFGDIQAPGAPTRPPVPGDVRALPDSTGVARPEQTPEQRLQELTLLRGQVEAAKREFLQRAQTFERMVRTIG